MVTNFSSYDKIGANMKRNPILGVVRDEGNYRVLPYISGHFFLNGKRLFLQKVLQKWEKI
jgi:hypothetical protein